MGRSFEELPEEKQMKIINAAMEVFAKSEYKKASTDDIASKAGISKGSLFNYFQNKRKLYIYLYEYTGKLMKDIIMDEDFQKITDFFEVMEYGATRKTSILNKNPYIADFAVRCFYSSDEAVSEELSIINTEYLEEGFKKYFCHVDFSKFKEHISPVKIYKMLVWMTDGYMHERKRMHMPIEVEDISHEFREWIDMLKPMLYKEEHLHGQND